MLKCTGISAKSIKKTFKPSNYIKAREFTLSPYCDEYLTVLDNFIKYIFSTSLTSNTHLM